MPARWTTDGTVIRDSVIWDAARDVGGRARNAATMSRSAVQAVRSSGLSLPLNPVVGLKMGRDLLVHGPSPAIGWAPGASRHPDDIAVIDETGLTLTYKEAEYRTRGATETLKEKGLGPGHCAAVLGRNSAGFAIAIAAVSRTGADLVYLNPGFSTAQLAEIIADRAVDLVLADPELLERLPVNIPTLVLNDLATWSHPRRFEVPDGGGRHIILTSGTTGKPKGADRSRTPLEAAVSLLAVLPYKVGATHVLASPMFHSWGWLNHRISSLLDTTEVMIARPTAEMVLDAAARHRAHLIITTPVVIRRLAEAGPGDRDLSSLAGVLVSGAPIPPDVIVTFRERFGDLIYNLYGSTEVGYASVASPEDLAAAPTTAGRPLPGVSVQILDPMGDPVAQGTEGEVWVGSSAAFEGYIDGGDKDRRGHLLSTGDLGLFDADGRLFIRGRNDDLIISGGENVHPTEVEDVLRRCPGVADVAAVGRPDPDYGQRVVVYVVPTPEATGPGLEDRVVFFAHENLAGYQRPREVVITDTLPRNETGKILRRML
jgi:acyl-CoA synthetase (AMP-forming)/AMP-acid ligase II